MSDNPEGIVPPRGAGVDVGTMNLLGARKNHENKVVVKRMRNAFLDLDASHKQFLKLSDVNYIEKAGKVHVLGDSALTLANMFNREVRRPMSRGLISSHELDTTEILSLMIEQLVGKARIPDEVLYFSVPAAPIDDPGQNITFHEGIFKRLIGELGYDAQPMNEAAAITFSEAASSQFSALSISFGAGMTNCALTFRTITTMQFSVARGGDWIDENSARASGRTASKIASLKEKEADLLDFESGDPKHLRSREAIQVYYKALIDYSLDNISKEFNKIAGEVDLPEPIPLIIGGGTSLAKNFLPFFKQEFGKRRDTFPIQISDVVHASDPLSAVSRGLLVRASLHY